MAKEEKQKKPKKDKKPKDKAESSSKAPMKRILLTDVRGTWVFLQAPRPVADDADEDADPTYEMELLLHKKKDAKQIAKLSTYIDQVGSPLGKKWNTPLHDGDDYNSDADEPRKYYENHMYVKCKTYYKPDVVTRTGEDAMPDDYKEMGFSGCYFHVSLVAKSYTHKSNKGVRMQLGNVMLRKAGERLDGRVAAADEFADYAENDYDDE